jgi:hypothetical protein
VSHSTTTFDRIVHLYEEAGRLLAKEGLLSDDDQTCFTKIREDLDQFWPKRRAELVFHVSGPPRLISAPDPRSQPQIRRFAHGIAPLPNGGD